MEKIPNIISGNSELNFHEIAKERRALRKAAGEIGNEGEIFDEHYKKPLEEAQNQAAEFKVSDFGGLKKSKEVLKKQRAEYEKKLLDEMSGIDYEAILSETPEIGKARKIIEGLAKLRDFRMLRMLETLNPKSSPATKKRNEAILETIREKIKVGEKMLTECDLSVLRQTELVEFKEDLTKSGHICITPNVGKDLEAIGDRMLTGKPMFLHGPTGTGKTSLASFAARHFTGKEAEMIYCSVQTRESNVWGKTGIKPTKSGGIETVELFGPLARAIMDGRPVIFDEFNSLPEEQMDFIKGVFSKKPGDMVNVPGNGKVEMKPGFQMIFTANIKSDKHPEKKALPNQVAREFEQNNLEIKYTNQAESYDIMLSRLLNRDGSLDISFYDLNTTLPNLCRAMAEIQESYTNETDKEVARRSGAMDASGKTYSLKKFVMTQGSVEAILSSWLIEKQLGEKDRSFSEFLDERFKTALTFKEYPKEDRILVAKILASRGFLITLSSKDIDLPENIFELSAIKQMRGEEAVEELREKSGDVRHLTLKEVAELDPFGKRAELLKNRAEDLLGGENGKEDAFLKGLNKRMEKIFGKERKSGKSDLSATYTHPDGKQENITISFEQKFQEFIDLYKTTNLNLPPDFEDSIRIIWETNQTEMEQAIQEKGFDEILIIPGNIPLSELSEKMKMEDGYGDYINLGGKTVDILDGANISSQNTNKPRIILVHNTQNLKDRPELEQTLNTKGKDVKPNEALSLEDYLVFQRKYFEKNQKHLDKNGGTWLSTKSGSRLVGSSWGSGNRRLSVDAIVLEYSSGNLGVRPSRCFF